MNDGEPRRLTIAPDLRALTVRAPWAWAIIRGLKRVENRGWRTSFRGRLAIHAGTSRESDADALTTFGDLGIEPPDELVRGAIIGTVEVVDVLEYAEFLRRFGGPLDRGFARGPFCWVLRDPIPCEPIFCGGNFQLWNVARRLQKRK